MEHRELDRQMNATQDRTKGYMSERVRKTKGEKKDTF